MPVAAPLDNRYGQIFPYKSMLTVVKSDARYGSKGELIGFLKRLSSTR